MHDAKRLARDYLLPTKDTFWEWADRGEAIVAKGGSNTIVFREELCEILRQLASRGLPRLDMVVLLLAATRANWIESGNRIRLACVQMPFENLSELIVMACRQLDQVHKMPYELRVSTEAKTVLAEMVFQEDRNRTSPEEAEAVVQLLGDSIEEIVDSRHRNLVFALYQPGLLSSVLRRLVHGLDGFSEEKLRLRLETGIDALPSEADVELPPREKVTRLLNSIEDKGELGEVARLSRKLVAAVALPSSPTESNELPVGGVSDITNRGSLDRLLISELAHDDLTLAVRVATNEALFLRRESPPNHPVRHRTILLDTGIRTWGVPRVYATSVALALISTMDANAELSTFSSAGDSVNPVDLTTRQGLINHLETLGADIHPGPSLPAWQSLLGKGQDASAMVLITTTDTYADESFLRALTTSPFSHLFVALVSRDGQFQLIERTIRGAKLIRRAQLDLDEIFKQEKTAVPKLLDKSKSRDLPAILFVDPFPLRLPHSIHDNRTWRVGNSGVLSITKDGRLMFWSNPGAGALQISDQIPPGELMWASGEGLDGKVYAVVAERSRPIHLLKIDLRGFAVALNTIEAANAYRPIGQHNGVLFMAHKSHIATVDLSSAQWRTSENRPFTREGVSGRFARDSSNGRWHALSFDGQAILHEPVMSPSVELRCPKLLAMFEHPSVEGPIGVTALGDLFITATGELRKIEHHLRGSVNKVTVSYDQSRVVLSSVQFNNSVTSANCTIDLDTLQTMDSYVNPRWSAEIYYAWIQQKTLRHRFISIGFDEAENLVLTSRKQQLLKIDYDADSNLIRLSAVAESHPLTGRRTFKKCAASHNGRFKLTVATWEDGSQAFLDTRGLLHLKSSDPSTPETTIVLTGGWLAGWSSDLGLWGTMYFLGDQQSASHEQIFFRDIRGFVRNCVP